MTNPEPSNVTPALSDNCGLGIASTPVIEHCRYVQRPALQTVVIVWKTPPDQGAVTAREYDANGTELRCHGAC